MSRMLSTNELQEAFRLAITSSSILFQFLEVSTPQILDGNLDTFQALRQIVETVREKLTSGSWNSFGKTLESLLGHGHGIGKDQAPFLGMLKEVQISRHLGFCSLGTLSRVTRCMTNYGIKTRLDVEGQSLADDLLLDPQGTTPLVLIRRIGEFQIVTVHGTFLRQALESGVSVVPIGPIFGSLLVPGSKSISNRVLLLAAMGQGSCQIQGLLDSDDIQVMLTALTHLGVKFEWTQDGDTLTVFGSGGKFKLPTQELFLGNSGTSSRFLTTAVAIVPNSNPGGEIQFTTITGNARMKERPIGPLVAALTSNGVSIKYLETEGCLPIAVGNTGLLGGTLELEGKVSSQYVSSILMVAPYALHPLTLQLAEESPVSLPYILMTLDIMRDFGIAVEFDGVNRFRIPKGTYRNPPQWRVEPDASSATYPLAMAAITGGEIRIPHLGTKSLQGDGKFFEVLGSMGCEVFQDEVETKVCGVQGGQRLRSVQINMENLTDTFMTVAVLAGVATGQRTEITGIANQRVKECNRIRVMVEELTKVGVTCDELPDGLWIEGIRDVADFKTPAYINCHDDHRIALSFAVLGSKVPGIVITDRDCTAKTYPGFWDDCRALSVSLCAGSLVSSPTNRNHLAYPVFLVGMRGCGKSTFGQLGAAALGLPYFCMDRALEAQFGTSLTSFVTTFGWAAFRLQEELLLRRIVSNPRAIIVSCGGGIVETPGCVELLSACRFVVHLQRPLGELKSFLEENNSRPSLPDDFELTMNRRLPLFHKVSRYEFTVKLDVGNQWEHPTAEFITFLQQILE